MAFRHRDNLTFFALFLLVAAFVVPVFASAATSAGVTPGSFWYFFDTASEKVALFFTFNPENKAKKALEYADERLAEIESIAEEKNPDAVKAAIADYEGNVALATEKSKEVKDKGQAESLFNSIENSASRNQEVLSAVLIKVPEEARAAIAQAIEASKRGQEEAARQIADLKGEVEKLKQEVAELKQEKDGQRVSEIERLRKEVEALKQSQAQQSKSVETKVVDKVVEKIVEVPRATPAQPAVLQQEKTSRIITLPNGAVVEIGEDGNIVRTIKEAPPRPDNVVAPLQSTQTQTSTSIQITSVNITPLLSSAQIEWQTNILTNSKIFLSGDKFSSKVYSSESGLSTRHIVNAVGLVSGTVYQYEIEVIAGDQVIKKSGSFSTVDRSEVLVEIKGPSNYGRVQDNLPYGNYSFFVRVLDKSGKYIKGAPVDMNAPDNLYISSSDVGTRYTVNLAGGGVDNWDANFGYVPTKPGIKVIKFISGNLVKSITIDVK